MAKKNGKKTATPAPNVETEDSAAKAALTDEPSVAQAAAARPTPESHPHLFDIFANPL